MFDKKILQQEIFQTVQKVKEIVPLVGSITNTVTINFVANAQLAAGGSAAMVYMPDEGESLADISQAFYINMGTQEPIYAEGVLRTMRRLHEKKIPWVLDPVGIGMGQLRKNLLLEAKHFPPAIIRGNASEIIALKNLWQLNENDAIQKNLGVRGVDSLDEVDDAIFAAMTLAKFIGGAVAVSGACDLVTDGNVCVRSKNPSGSKFFPKITGAGCSLGGVMAVYAAAGSPLVAAVTGMNAYNLAGELAEKQVNAPASFQIKFLDELFLATPEQISSVEIFCKEEF